MFVPEDDVAPCGLKLCCRIRGRHKHRPQDLALDQPIDGRAIQRSLVRGGSGSVFPVRSKVSLHDRKSHTVTLLELMEHLFVSGLYEAGRYVAFVPLPDEVRERRIGRAVVAQRVGKLDNFVRIRSVIQLSDELHDLLVAEFA